MKNGIKNFVIFVLVLLLGTMATILFVNYREKEEFKNELEMNRKTNDSLQKKNLEKNKELIDLLKKNQIELNSLNGISSKNQVIDGVLLGNKPISIEELIKIANNYQDNNFQLKNKSKNDSLTIIRLNDIINQLDKDKVIRKQNNGKFTYYPKLDSLYETKSNELSKLKTELQAKNMLLGLIKKNYDIDTEIEYENDIIKAKLTNTKKLDSALWIFPYYKHKIKNNKKGETIIK